MQDFSSCLSASQPSHKHQTTKAALFHGNHLMEGTSTGPAIKKTVCSSCYGDVTLDKSMKKTRTELK